MSGNMLTSGRLDFVTYIVREFYREVSELSVLLKRLRLPIENFTIGHSGDVISNLISRN